MYYTTCGSGDFTNIDHMWLKTVRLQYSVHWRGTLPNFSHKQRESAETSEHFAKQERIELGPQVTQSPHDVMVRQNLTNACTNLSQYWTSMQRECLFYWVDELKLLWNPECLPFTQTTQVEILCINIYYSDANSPAFGRRLTLFCLISRSPALVHKSPAFYVRYKYWILSKKLNRLSLKCSPFLAKNLTFSYSQYSFWGIFARI